MKDAGSGRTVVRAVGTAVAVLASALLCGRLFATAVDDVVPAHSKFTLGTLRRASAMIEAAATAEHDAAFVGTSSVWTGFDPRVFDAEMVARGHPLTTANYGVYPARTSLRRAVVQRLCAAHAAKGTRWKLMLYEVATEDWIHEIVAMEENDAGMMAFDRAVHAMAIEPAMLARTFVVDPGEGASLLAGRILGHRAPYAVVDAVRNHLYQDLTPDGWRPEPTEEERPFFERLAAWWRFADLYGAEGGVGWVDEARGFSPIRSPATLAAYDALLRVNSTEAAREQQQQDAAAEGMTGMNVSSSAVEKSIELIRELSRCPNRVVLVVMPISPVVLGALEPGARARFDATIAQIQSATGLPLINLVEVPGLDVTGFQDSLHVTINHGSQIVSKTLALRVVELLAGSR